MDLTLIDRGSRLLDMFADKDAGIVLIASAVGLAAQLAFFVFARAVGVVVTMVERVLAMLLAVFVAITILNADLFLAVEEEREQVREWVASLIDLALKSLP